MNAPAAGALRGGARAVMLDAMPPLRERLRSPISSKNRVPPFADSIRPILRSTPDATPFSMPNNSLSTSVSGSAAQFTATNGFPLRGLM